MLCARDRDAHPGPRCFDRLRCAGSGAPARARSPPTRPKRAVARGRRWRGRGPSGSALCLVQRVPGPCKKSATSRLRLPVAPALTASLARAYPAGTKLEVQNAACATTAAARSGGCERCKWTGYRQHGWMQHTACSIAGSCVCQVAAQAMLQVSALHEHRVNVQHTYTQEKPAQRWQVSRRNGNDEDCRIQCFTLPWRPCLRPLAAGGE